MCIWGARAKFIHACVAAPSPSFPSSDINMWANAVRQLLLENPQQSLAVTTWECSSEGHALHCDYKQHGGKRATSPASLMFCAMLKILKASSFGWGRHLQPQSTVAVLFFYIFFSCHSHFLIAVNISEGRRCAEKIWWWQYKTVMAGAARGESNVQKP